MLDEPITPDPSTPLETALTALDRAQVELKTAHENIARSKQDIASAMWLTQISQAYQQINNASYSISKHLDP